MFMSTHYAGEELNMKFEDREPWKKVFGPTFVYLNSVSTKKDLQKLWVDAKEQVCTYIYMV